MAIEIWPVTIPTGPRSLGTIAREIIKTWRRKDGTGSVYFGAVPYLEAMHSLSSMDDWYGNDSAHTVVIYFLSNATTWRGADARRIKAELKKIAGLK